MASSFFSQWTFVVRPAELRAKPSAKDWRVTFITNIQKQIDLLTGKRQPTDKLSPKGRKFGERPWYGEHDGKYYAGIKLSNKFISNGEKDAVVFDSKNEVIDFYKTIIERTGKPDKELDRVLISHRQKVQDDRGVKKAA